jgi:hypothetical protein
MVAPLPKQPVVYNALGSFISDKVFSEATVKQEVADALPPRAAFLSTPLTNQLKNLTTRVSQNVVSSDAFQTIWAGANRAAMDRLLTRAREKQSPKQSRLEQKFDLNLSGAADQLRVKLGNVSTAIPTLQPNAKPSIDVKTDLHAKGSRLHEVIRGIDNLARILPLFVTATLLGALAFSLRRLHTTVTISIVTLILLLIELVGLKAGRQAVLDQVQNRNNLSAVGYIYDTLSSGLKDLMIWSLVGSIVVLLICWLLGPSRWAQSFRSWSRISRWQGSNLQDRWHDVRRWVRRREYYLWLALGVILLGVMAIFIDVTARSVVNAVLLLLSLVAAVHIVATPRKLQRAKVQ